MKGSSNFRLALMSRRRIVKSAMRDDSTIEENDGLVLARNFVQWCSRRITRARVVSLRGWAPWESLG